MEGIGRTAGGTAPTADAANAAANLADEVVT